MIYKTYKPLIPIMKTLSCESLLRQCFFTLIQFILTIIFTTLIPRLTVFFILSIKKSPLACLRKFTYLTRGEIRRLLVILNFQKA